MKKPRVITNIDFEVKSRLLKNIFWVVVILVLMFFAVYPLTVFKGNVSPVRTQTAVQQTVYDTIDVDAFAVRSEVCINNTYQGTIVPAVANGNKVAIGDPVADIYTNETAAQNASRLKELQNEIEYYRSIESAVGGTLQTDIDLYKSGVTKALFSLSSCIENNELSEIYAKSRELREAITRKQIAIGTPVDVSGIITQLTNEYSSLEKSVSVGSSIQAPQSGYYVNTADGYENTVDFENVKNLNYLDVKNILNTEPSLVSSDNVGKLITDFNWYLVCNTTIDKLGNIRTGTTVTVTFTNSPVDELKMSVIAINQADSDTPVTLILGSNIMNEDIADLRLASIKIRVEAFTGLAVDRQSLRTVDGVKGVYVKVGNIAEFKKVNIIYSDENIILSAAPENERGYLELYDDIILEGTDLYDSKLLD